MDTTSTDLISYLLCRGSASSFGLPLFIILKKKLHQKKIKGRSFRVPSTLTKDKSLYQNQKTQHSCLENYITC